MRQLNTNLDHVSDESRHTRITSCLEYSSVTEWSIDKTNLVSECERTMAAVYGQALFLDRFWQGV